ncbi:MAG: TRAP transporter fused permease subunit [Burkholderiales bacterium]|nr:TRAP transporter fused permease subunit [Burkholderiales bacterium]
MSVEERARPADAAPGEELPRDPDDAHAAERGPATLPGRAAYWLGVALALAHIYFNTLGTMSELRVSAVHFGGFALMCALLYPTWRARTPAGRRAALAIDVALGLAALSCVVYLFLGEESFARRNASFLWYDWIFTGLAVVLAIEFTRRTTGWIIPIIIVTAFTYVVWWGRYVPGMLTFPGLSLETTLFRAFYTDDGMLGLIATISATFVVMFILFGAFLTRSGAGDFIIDLARAVAGRLIGGPGFVAVLGSALMGTISGSSVANTVSTGVITIPLMKRAGFPGRFAAGVEAAASTGGQLMPPIMGAGAFVMASYTQIPYLTIAAVSVLPAILYFLSVGCYVRIQAKRLGLKAESAADTPTITAVLKRGGLPFFLPIVVLVGMLVYGFTPTYCAGTAIVAVIVSSWLTPGKRGMGPADILDALALGARNMVVTAMLLVAIGLVVLAVATTGIGNTFSLMIEQWAGGSLMIALALIALASLVLGMGLPVTASYIVLATLSAPALAGMITQQEMINAFMAGNVPESLKAVLTLVAPDKVAALGQAMSYETAEALVKAIPQEFRTMAVEQTLSPAQLTGALLAAHMIIFWLSQDSSVTPPVCLTAFAAAAIAKTPPMATGFTSWRLAKGLYIVPLLFAYTPFLNADLWTDLQISFFAAFGIYALAASTERWMEARLPLPLAAVLFAVGVALLWPTDLLVNFAGLAIFLAIFAHNLWQDRRGARAAAA